DYGWLEYWFERTSTDVVHALVERLFAGGLDALLSVDSQALHEPRFARLAPGGDVVPPPTDRVDFEGAYGLYYREVFFHTPFLIAGQLHGSQRFEEAQRWYHCIFDPTAAVAATTPL